MRYPIPLLAVLCSAGAVHAIPNAEANPHPNGASDISYIQDGSRSPEQTNHFHLPLRSGESLSFSSDVNSYGLKSNGGWGAQHAWDDRTNRFADTPEDGDGRNALLDRFGHGYVNASRPVLYSFEDNVPNGAQTLLAEALAAWETAAKAQSAGKTTSSGKALITSLKFNQAPQGESSQYYYRFSDAMQGTRKVYAEWVVSEDRVPLGGGVSGRNSMVFEADPFNFVRAPEGVTLKVAGQLVSTNTFTRRVGWSFDKTPDAIEVDLQYVKDGQTFESLPGEELTTNTFLKIPAADKISFYQMDFWTIALHETGHILGLLHADGDPTGNIMRANVEWQAAWNTSLLQSIDADSAFGAAMLYTIPVPEPSTVLIWAAAVVFIRRRPRSQVCQQVG